MKRASITAAGAAVLHGFNVLRAGESANRRIRLAVMGCNGRGMAHIAGWLAQPNVEIAAICDVDSRALEKGVAAVTRKQDQRPQGVRDIRRVLDDKTVDAISVATPNHWHTPAAILACNAGKHVYVEKPGSHTARECELIVTAARKHRRLVQMGNQRRSWPWVIEAIERLHAGEIGKVLFARTWYNALRGSIGRGKPAPVPDWLDFALWQGPAPERPFVDNLVHYNWHWRWHWGNGELGNNGVHFLDLARWGLQVDQPRRVTCGGNRYHFQDDQETPDTCLLCFDFGGKGLSWECHSCHPHGLEGGKTGVIFYGDKGALVIADYSCKFLDLDGKETAGIPAKGDDVRHFANFLDAIRDGKKLNSEIEEGQKAALLCHLGNIAWRTGGALDFDPAQRRIRNNPAAAKLWSREYRRGWEPKV